MSFSIEKVLRAQVPLKLVLVTEQPGAGHPDIREAITQAFHGGPATAERGKAYYPGGEDLGVEVLEADFGKGQAEARAVVEAARADALHCLLVALLYDEPSKAFKDWLRELEQAVDASALNQPGLAMLPIAVREGVWQGDIQALQYASLGEMAIRPVNAAVHVLSCAWRMLGDEDDRLKLFISHAKLDGLPLAQSFKYQLSDFHGLERFYDADNILPGSNWRKVLRNGVQNAVVVALRTDVYDERVWCVQELDWAEDYGCPVIIVEARTHLVRPRESLPVGGAPSVQVPDGNLLRVLQSALREALRVRLFLRQASAVAEASGLDPASVLTVPRTSLATLGMRCEGKAKDSIGFVFVPEPFREAHRLVALRLVQAYFPKAWLGTPKMWIDEALAQDAGKGAL